MNFFDSPELFDIEFVFPDQRSIKAHRSVLSAASSHMSITWQSFSRMSITSYPYPVFCRYLLFLYTHTLSTDDIDQLMSLARLAKDYDELSLLQACVRRLSVQLNIDNCIRVYELAVDLQLEHLENQASEIIIREIGRVKLTEGYKNFNIEKIKKLLETLCTL